MCIIIKKTNVDLQLPIVLFVDITKLNVTVAYSRNLHYTIVVHETFVFQNQVLIGAHQYLEIKTSIMV